MFHFNLSFSPSCSSALPPLSPKAPLLVKEIHEHRPCKLVQSLDFRLLPSLLISWNRYLELFLFILYYLLEYSSFRSNLLIGCLCIDQLFLHVASWWKYSKRNLVRQGILLDTYKKLVANHRSLFKQSHRGRHFWSKVILEHLQLKTGMTLWQFMEQFCQRNSSNFVLLIYRFE